MDKVFVLLALVLLIGGIVLMSVSLRFRTAHHPGLLSFHPRNWKPFWCWKEWYSPLGFWMAVCGALAVSLGAITSIAASLLK